MPNAFDFTAAGNEDVTPYNPALVAADVHNYANGDPSFYDSMTWQDKAEQTLSNAAKFTVAAAVSGVAGLWNTGVDLTRLVTQDEKIANNAINIQDTLQNFDNNLGDYYAQNKTAIDMTGFIGTSLISGIGGVKILNAGTKLLQGVAEIGSMGRNLSMGTGLLESSIVRYAQEGARAIEASGSTISAINSGVLKALGTGAAKATLESAVFEVSALVTQYKSPFLENQSSEDIIKNMVVGTVLGGAIGSIGYGLRIMKGIKTEVAEFDKVANTYKYATSDSLPESVSASDRIIMRTAERDIKLSNPVQEGFDQINKNTVERITQAIKQDTEALGGGRQLFELVSGADSASVRNALLNIKSMALAGTQEADAATRVMRLYGEDAGAVVALGKDEQVAKQLGDYFTSVKDAKQAAANYLKRGLDEVSVDAGTISPLELQTRYIAMKAENAMLPKVIGTYDIPALERAVEMDKLGLRDIQYRTADGSLIDLATTAKDIQVKLAMEAKQGLINKLADVHSVEEMAAITNVRRSYIKGTVSQDEFSDMFAQQAAFKDYNAAMTARGLPVDPDVIYRSTWAAVKYDKELIDSAKQLQAQSNSLNALRIAETRAKIVDDTLKAVAQVDKDILPKIDISRDILDEVNRFGAGAGFFSYASGAMRSLKSKLEYIGKYTNITIKQNVDKVMDEFSSAATALRNSKEAAIEYSVIQQKLLSTGRTYVFDDASQSLIHLNDAGHLIDEIPIKNPEAWSFLKESQRHITKLREAQLARMEALGENTSALREVIQRQGIFPVRQDPKSWKHVAYVVDNSLTQGAEGRVSMLFADSAENLERMKTAAKQSGPQYDIFDTRATANFHKLAEDYSRSESLWQVGFDSTKARQGVAAPFFAQTDPGEIVNGVTDYLAKQISRDVRSEVSLYYHKEFSTIKGLGDEFMRAQESKLGGKAITDLDTLLDDTSRNPAYDYIKTALDVNKRSDFPVWEGFNTLMERGFQKAFTAMEDIWRTKPSTEAVNEVSNLLEKYGAKTAYNDAALQLFRNHLAGNSALSNFVRTANSVMATFTLRLDILNAFNNALGANILLTSELKSEIGKLRNIPEFSTMVNGNAVVSPSKLISGAYADLFKGADRAYFERIGSVPQKTASVIEQTLDAASLTGSETASQLSAKASKLIQMAKDLANKGEVYTGNRWAEYQTRYISSNVAKKLGEAIGLEGGDLAAYITSFTNRCNTNLLTSQRPVLFQGPVGQAMGLFQSYQFNFMQRIFEQVAEGRTKDLAMLMGLQSTLYGVKGLPGFNYLNEHIVGTMSGNKEHVDAYDVSRGIFGKQAGDLLMYGIPSNMLGMGLFSRGDLNPRQLTIIPTQVSEIPVVGATVQMFKNAKDAITNIDNGAPIWNSMLDAIEHNQISRPMSGVAQLAKAFTSESGQAFASTTKGSLIGASDLISFSSLIRVAGGKPVDEAMTQDKLFRIGYYKSIDKAALDSVAETAKVTFGGKPHGVSTEQLDSIMRSYVAAGGNQTTFNQWAIKQMLGANTPVAQQMADKLRSKNSQKLQQLMGGIPSGFSEE
jgi:hypothetical protein